MLLFPFPCISFHLVNVRSDISKGGGENISGCISIDGEDKMKISEKLGKKKEKGFSRCYDLWRVRNTAMNKTIHTCVCVFCKVQINRDLIFGMYGGRIVS